MIIIGDLHLYAGNTCAVFHAHIATYASRMLAEAHGHIGLGIVHSFAVADREHLVFIGLQRRYVLVLIARLVKQVYDGIPLIVAASLATLNLEIIHYAVNAPSQHHAALASLGHKFLVHLTCAGMIECGKIGLQSGVFGCEEHYRFWHYGLTFFFPVVAEDLQQVSSYL